MAQAILGLGTNLGNKMENLESAIEALSLIPRTKVEQVSHFYETAPFQVPDEQDVYLNCCVKISTELNPHTLLGCCLGIEAAMGRKRLFRFCSRIIDIDLLIYDEVDCDDKDLTLPHPRMKERAFVMVPLNDLCENQKFGNVDFAKELDICDKSEIKLVK